MKCVILGAGFGTRLRPLTFDRSKLLIEIAGKPIIQHLIDLFLEFRIKDFILVVGHDIEGLKRYFEKKDQDINIEYVLQNEIDGTASAVGIVEPLVEDEFIVVNGDVLFSSKFLEGLLDKKGFAMSLSEVDDPTQYGTVDISNHLVRDIFEKKPNSKSNLANVGIYKFQKEIFSAIKNTKKSSRSEYELTDSLKLLIDQGSEIEANVVYSWWSDLGRPWDLLDANKYYLSRISESKIEGKIEKNVHIDGNIILGKNSLIKSGSYIVGPCIFGDNTKIGPNCSVRPYAFVGDNCNIGSSVDLKNSIIMDDTNLAHLNYVGDSIIGRNCNLGAGAKIANVRHDKKTIKMKIKNKLVDSKRKKLGAVLGDNTKIGINVSIYPGRKIGPDSFVDPSAVVVKNIGEGKRYTSEGKIITI